MRNAGELWRPRMNDLLGVFPSKLKAERINYPANPVFNVMDLVPAADLLWWDQDGFCFHQEFPGVPSDEPNAMPRVRARDANQK